MVLYLGVILLSLVVGSIFYKKQNLILGFFLASYLAFITASMPSNISDFSIYKNEYDNHLMSMEPLYNLLSKIASYAGLNYEQFRYIIAIGFFLVLYWAIVRLKLNSLLIFAIYGIFPFFVDAIQIRILGYTAFFVLALSFFKDGSRKNLIISEILLIVGTGFHSIGLIFVLFPVFYYIQRRYSDRMIFFFMTFFNLFVALFLVFFGKKWLLGGGLASLISTLTGRETLGNLLTSYYVESASLFGLIIWWAIIIFAFSIVFIIKERENQLNYTPVISGIGRTLLIITSLSIPLLVMGGTYSRVYRIGFFIIAILFIEYMTKVKDKLRNKFILASCFSVALASSAYLIYLGNVINQIPDILNK